MQKIYDFLEPIPKLTSEIFLWNPVQPPKNIYSEVLLAQPELQSSYYTSLGVNLFPATDDRPFMERLSQFGKKTLRSDLPPEFSKREKQKWAGVVPVGDFPYVAILVESLLLAFLFIGIPLAKSSLKSARIPGFWSIVSYFACLGFSFIVVEICLMKRYVLFLGHPAYSITTVVVVLLLGAGLGSLLTARFKNSAPRAALVLILPLIALALLSEAWLSPLIFEKFLYAEFIERIFIGSAMLLPLGILMGMPFPLGLRIIQNMSSEPALQNNLTAWAWGMNGYATVVGSAATVFISLFLGFQIAIFCAIAGYLLAGLTIWLGSKS